MQRLKDKRVDPLTGEFFNMDVPHLQPNTDAQSVRLVTLKQDEEAIVLKCVEGFSKSLNLIEESFKNCLYTIDASLDIEKVTEKIEYAINNGVWFCSLTVALITF